MTRYGKSWMMAEPVVTIVVHGMPAPQGSKRAFRNRHTGRIHQVESSAAVAPWRQDVKHAALSTVSHLDYWSVLTGPVVASMVFSFERPKSHWRTGRNAHRLRGSAPAYPAGRPDLSKLIRSTEDALTGVIWKDDEQVVEFRTVAKRYTTDVGRGLPVLPHPGAVIDVWELASIDYAPSSDQGGAV